MQDLGTLGGKSSTATGLNNSGQVVGWSTTTTATTSPERAFLWTESGGMVALGMLPVIYDFSGFFRPVEDLPTMNAVNAGSSVAIKFSLNGNHTLAVLDGAPVSAPMICGDSAVNVIEEMPAASPSALSYDASSDQYIYIWKTDKAWGGTCRQLALRLVDGTIRRANFQLK